MCSCMKIVHIAPNAPYNDYWGYQDNLLPKYHKRLGHEVTMITTNTMHKDGKIVETDCADYVLEDGVRLIRLKRTQYPHRILTGLNSRLSVYPYLCEIQPDFVFFHGLVSSTIYEVIKYKKKINPNCTIVQDNHVDYFNGSGSKTVREKTKRAFYRRLHRKSRRFVERIYGVTPWRKQYAEDYFAVSPMKTDVLIMGADDEKIDFSNMASIRASLREKHHVSESDFLIVTGGKIDADKNIDVLMRACAGYENIKLLVFGTPSPEMKDLFNQIAAGCDNILTIGWISAEQVYDYFMAADLVVFPGSHSVLWEQACACKVPCIFRYWEGMDHVNNGGNAMFLDEITEDTIINAIMELHFTERYFRMLDAAKSEKTDIYRYSYIAKKSLECWKET